MLKITLIILAYFIPLSIYAQSQSVKFERLTVKDGLPHHTIYDILQDKTGFMWFGTENGLSRFDGYQLTNFYPDLFDSTAITGGNISSLDIDSSGNIWLGFLGEGVSYFNPKLGKFYTITNKPGSSVWLNDMRAQVVFVDKSQRIWIGTYRAGLYVYNQQANEVTRYFDGHQSPLHQLTSNRIWSIKETKKYVYVGTETGLNRIDKTTGVSATIFTGTDKLPNLLNTQIRTIFIGTDDKLWIGTENGLYVFHEPTNKMINSYFHQPENPNSISENVINNLVADNSGNLWIGTYSRGLNRLNLTTGNFERYVADVKNPNSLSSNDVRTMYKDRSGTIWMGTRGGALVRFNQEVKKFNYLTSEPNNPNSLIENDISSLYEDRNGNIWIGSFLSGLTIYNPKTGKYSRMSHQPGNNQSIGANLVNVISGDAEGNIWIGTRNNGITVYSPTTNKFTHYKSDPNDPTSVASQTIWSFHLDKKNRMWVGTKEGGLNLFNSKTKTFKTWKFDFNNSNSIQGNDIRFISEDSRGRIWVGTDGGGLHLFDEEADAFQNFKNDPKNRQSISNNDVTSFFEDKNGKLWFGTEGGGLNSFDPLTGKFEHINQKSGLQSNTVYHILSDNQGYLWLMCFNGISRLNPISGEIKNYNEADGLQGSIFNIGAALKTKDGVIYVGGTNGLSYFRPELIIDNPHLPKVVLTSFKVFGNEVQLGKNIFSVDSINLSYKDNFFSFEFTALDFVNPYKNQYAYRLVGFDPDWIYSGTRRYVSYTNLTKGDYTFQVKAANNDGKWNDHHTEISIHITPPFWNTTWFYLAMILVAVTFVYIMVWFRVRHMNEQKKELALLVANRTQELFEKNKALEHALDNLKSTQSQLFQREKMASLGTLVAGVAHEINNPINFIHTSIEPLGRDFQELSKVYEMIKTLIDNLKVSLENGDQNQVNQLAEKLTQQFKYKEIQELEQEIKLLLKGIDTGSKRTADIVKSLRTFTRTEDDTIQKYNIHDGIESSLQLLMPQWKNKITIEKEYSDQGEIECNPGQMNQVLMNLLSNSIQAIDKEGKIKITTSSTDNHLKIKIQDSGVGIPKEHISRMFEPFFTTKKIGKGTGLGLSITYNIIEKHNGKVDVYSEVGKGTEFVVTLPKIQTTLKATGVNH